MRTARFQAVAALALATSSAACSDPNLGEVSLQIATRRPAMMTAGATSAAGAAPGQLTITLGQDQIVFDQVQIVLRKIRLDGAPTASCPEDGEGDSQCAEVRLGPVLFDLPLGDGAEPAFTALVPVGTYEGLHFQIHKPSNANEDADLVAEHPEMAGISIRATGSYNGTAFSFASDLTEVEQVALAAPVEVAEDLELPLTLQVDASAWFVNQSGTGLLDPAQANDGQPLEAEVERNIRESFRAFRDGDADGIED